MVIGSETTNSVRLSFGRLNVWLAGRSVCHNFLKVLKVTISMLHSEHLYHHV